MAPIVWFIWVLKDSVSVGLVVSSLCRPRPLQDLQGQEGPNPAGSGCPDPKGSRYFTTRYSQGFHIQNRDYGFGYVHYSWVLGPFGYVSRPLDPEAPRTQCDRST